MEIKANLINAEIGLKAMHAFFPIKTFRDKLKLLCQCLSNYIQQNTIVTYFIVVCSTMA